jgi:hypothetical protein
LFLVPLMGLAPGCGQKAAAPSQAPVVEHAPPGPSQIHLSDARVSRVGPKLVEFEVKYRFTQGRPDKYYSCDVSFPGTPNLGVKRMESWELRPEGMIRDRIELSRPGVKTFAIHLSEATSPREAYKKVSNVVTGPVQ